MPDGDRSDVKSLAWLTGSWTTEATHPAVPGVIVRGTVEAEWLEGEQFLIYRARTDHPDFPDSISIIGNTGHDRVDDSSGKVASAEGSSGLRLHYYDSRGVFRAFDASGDETSLQFSMTSPEWSQRFSSTLAAGGDVIHGQSQLCRDGVHWVDDLKITYRRDKPR